MQDKIFMVKNYVSLRCIDAVKRLNADTAKMTDLDEISIVQVRNYEKLLAEIMDDILDTKMDSDNKKAYLLDRFYNKEVHLRQDLIKKDSEQYLQSDTFQHKI